MPIAIMVHGGAGPVAADDNPTEHARGCLEAARAGHEVLRQGGSALDAVEVAARVLEDNPLFNAGTGACLTADGEVEADASLMDGSTLGAGAVTVVKGVKNPIRLARLVMEKTPHVLIAGEGALRLAREHGVELVDPQSLVTPRARAKLKAFLEKRQATGGNTIGAVALDQGGHVAAATSTGGTVGKRSGRVGDTPLVGCGTYADDLGGAVSATGQGEFIIKAVMAKVACDFLRAGRPAQEAADAALRELARVGGQGGLILVDRYGNLAFALNTDRMSRAAIDRSGLESSEFSTFG